jgi:hypothetical protein
MAVLCPDESKPVTKKRYEQFLLSFMIQSEQEEGQQNHLEDSVVRVARSMYKQGVQPEQIWKVREVNIGMVVFGLLKYVKLLDVLDCVACYCRCDPLKSGVINTASLINLLKQRVADFQNFEGGAVQFKLAKN